MKNLAIGKIVGELKKRCPGLSDNDYYIAIYLDDFWDWLKEKGKTVYNAVGGFYNDNKDIIDPILKQAAALAGKAALSALGGNKLWSEDPYAIDEHYLRTIFSRSPLDNYHPAPRQTVIPLAKIFNRSTYNLTTNANGTLMVLCNPYGSFFTQTLMTTTDTWFPWLVINASGGQLVYNSGVQSTGPFQQNVGQVAGFYPDLSTMRFQCTLAPLNRQGAVASTVFYEPWQDEADLAKNSSYNSQTLQLTPAQIDSNVSTTKNSSLQEFIELKPINRWIPSEVDLTQSPLQVSGTATNNRYAFQVLYFYGCAPFANIGKLYVESGISFNPTAANVGIFPTQIRGGYPGTHSFIHQCRKLGTKLQTTNTQYIGQLIKPNFAEVDFSAVQNNIFGKFVEISDVRCIYNPQTNGLCFPDCCRYLGINVAMKPWVTLQQALTAPVPITVIPLYGDQYTNNLQGFLRVVLDVPNSHCYVIDTQRRLGGKQQSQPIIQDCVDRLIGKGFLSFGTHVINASKGFKNVIHQHQRVVLKTVLLEQNSWFSSFPDNWSTDYIQFSDTKNNTLHVEKKTIPQFVDRANMIQFLKSYEQCNKVPFITKSKQIYVIENDKIYVKNMNGLILHQCLGVCGQNIRQVFQGMRLNFDTQSFVSNTGQILSQPLVDINSTIAKDIMDQSKVSDEVSYSQVKEEKLQQKQDSQSEEQHQPKTVTFQEAKNTETVYVPQVITPQYKAPIYQQPNQTQNEFSRAAASKLAKEKRAEQKRLKNQSFERDRISRQKNRQEQKGDSKVHDPHLQKMQSARRNDIKAKSRGANKGGNMQYKRPNNGRSRSRSQKTKQPNQPAKQRYQQKIDHQGSKQPRSQSRGRQRKEQPQGKQHPSNKTFRERSKSRSQLPHGQGNQQQRSRSKSVQNQTQIGKLLSYIRQHTHTPTTIKQMLIQTHYYSMRPAVQKSENRLLKEFMWGSRFLTNTSMFSQITGVVQQILTVRLTKQAFQSYDVVTLFGQPLFFAQLKDVKQQIISKAVNLMATRYFLDHSQPVHQPVAQRNGYKSNKNGNRNQRKMRNVVAGPKPNDVKECKNADRHKQISVIPRTQFSRKTCFWDSLNYLVQIMGWKRNARTIEANGHVFTYSAQGLYIDNQLAMQPIQYNYISDLKLPHVVLMGPNQVDNTKGSQYYLVFDLNNDHCFPSKRQLKITPPNCLYAALHNLSFVQQRQLPQYNNRVICYNGLGMQIHVLGDVGNSKYVAFPCTLAQCNQIVKVPDATFQFPGKGLKALSDNWFFNLSTPIPGQIHVQIAEYPAVMSYDKFYQMVKVLEDANNIADYFTGDGFFRVSQFGLQVLDLNKKVVDNIPASQITREVYVPFFAGKLLNMASDQSLTLFDYESHKDLDVCSDLQPQSQAQQSSAGPQFQSVEFESPLSPLIMPLHYSQISQDSFQEQTLQVILGDLRESYRAQIIEYLDDHPIVPYYHHVPGLCWTKIFTDAGCIIKWQSTKLRLKLIDIQGHVRYLIPQPMYYHELTDRMNWAGIATPLRFTSSSPTSYICHYDPQGKMHSAVGMLVGSEQSTQQQLNFEPQVTAQNVLQHIMSKYGTLLTDRMKRNIRFEQILNEVQQPVAVHSQPVPQVPIVTNLPIPYDKTQRMLAAMTPQQREQLHSNFQRVAMNKALRHARQIRERSRENPKKHRKYYLAQPAVVEQPIIRLRIANIAPFFTEKGTQFKFNKDHPMHDRVRTIFPTAAALFLPQYTQLGLHERDRKVHKIQMHGVNLDVYVRTMQLDDAARRWCYLKPYIENYKYKVRIVSYVDPSKRLAINIVLLTKNGDDNFKVFHRPIQLGNIVCNLWSSTLEDIEKSSWRMVSLNGIFHVISAYDARMSSDNKVNRITLDTWLPPDCMVGAAEQSAVEILCTINRQQLPLTEDGELEQDSEAP